MRLCRGVRAIPSHLSSRGPQGRAVRALGRVNAAPVLCHALLQHTLVGAAQLRGCKQRREICVATFAVIFFSKSVIASLV